MSEWIRREGASIGLCSGRYRPGGCAERRPSRPLPGEATSAGCCRRPPPQPRRSGSATRGRIYAGAPPARRSGRDGTGRGGARRGGEGAAAAGAPGAAGGRRGAVSAGAGRRCGARAVAELTPAAAAAAPRGCRLFFPPFFFALSCPPCPASQGKQGSPTPGGAGSRRPLAPGDSGAPRFSRTPRRGRAVVPGGTRTLHALATRHAWCSAFPCAFRPVVGGGAHFAPGQGRAAQRLRWFLPGKKPPAPGQVCPRRPRLCGHRGVIEKEAGKAEVDCTSYAEKHGQTHPIYNRQKIETGEVANCVFI
ncbi:uncharacterized protein J5F26_005372 isoform 1-T1 [Ciconia maguari]